MCEALDECELAAWLDELDDEWLGFGCGFGCGRVVPDLGATVVPLAVEKDQPSKPPTVTVRVAAPSLLYVQLPPFDACQYDQYLVVGGVLKQESWDVEGLPSMRQTKAGPS